MPLVRIDLAQGKPVDYRTTIGDVVYDAMLQSINVPDDDRFQIITSTLPTRLIFNRTYLGIERTHDCVFIQVTLERRSIRGTKQAFFKAIADGLHERLELRREDVFINLVEVVKENWSFGNGEASVCESS